MKRLYIYTVLASILVAASCQKPIGETPKPKPGVETPKPKPGVETPKPKPGVETPKPKPGVETPEPKQWYVSTLAGSRRGYGNATGTAAQFNNPRGMAVSPDGKTLYVADTHNHRIREIALPSGEVTTFAGGFMEGGFSSGAKDASTGTEAQFNSPSGIAVSPDGSALYVADTYNHRIRKIALPSGDVTTFAGSTDGYADATGTAARFNGPGGIAVSPDGNTLYVVDSNNYRIRKIDISSKKVETVAGSPIEANRLYGPHGIAVSPDGNTLYLADMLNHRIVKIALPSGEVTTFAGSTEGDAVGIDTEFTGPYGIAVSSDGKTLYVADTYNHRIGKIDISSKKVETIAGGTRGKADATGTHAQFNRPYSIAVASDGTLYVTGANDRIRMIEFR